MQSEPSFERIAPQSVSAEWLAPIYEGTKMFVIKRNDDGLYVARPGQHRSYTNKLEEAWKFHTREFAEQEKYANESVVLHDVLLKQSWT